MKKKLMTLALAAGLVMSCTLGANDAKAIDFKASGTWEFVWGGGQGLVDHARGRDNFKAMQNVGLQIDAVASESLSGTLIIETGDTNWGKSLEGGQLGTDGEVIGVVNAYIDWFVPNTQLQFRMGLQPIAFPAVAGGAAILDDDMAGIVANYKFNDNVGMTFAWARPFNDNFKNNTTLPGGNSDNYLDNMDIFMLSVPMEFDGIAVNPWFSYGVFGRNAAKEIDGDDITYMYGKGDQHNAAGFDAYGDMWFAGLPIAITAVEGWNFEIDFNYGYTGISHDQWPTHTYDEGWVVKGLAEYSLDWGTPGLFFWYGSGDDDKGVGSMPVLSGGAAFTTFVQDGSAYGFHDHDGWMTSFSGTWGLGLQIRDMSFVEDLSHTLRVTYFGGTNDGANRATEDWTDGYLTYSDYLVEINFDTAYQIYDNLTATVELGYVVNGIDADKWEKVGGDQDVRDAWKSGLVMCYSF